MEKICPKQIEGIVTLPRPAQNFVPVVAVFVAESKP